MKVVDMTFRAPVTVEVDVTVREAASLMARHGVGALVVTDQDRPVGIVTDRDLVTRSMAVGGPIDGRIDSLMSMGIVALDHTADVDELFDVFTHHAVRRVPIVDHDRVVGLIALDDVIVSMMNRLDQVAKVVAAQAMFPHARDEATAPVAVEGRRP